MNSNELTGRDILVIIRVIKKAKKDYQKLCERRTTPRDKNTQKLVDNTLERYTTIIKKLDNTLSNGIPY